MNLLTINHWQAYELLDAGQGQKLERFGDHVLIRPEPQALWPARWSKSEWEKRAHVQFLPTASNSGQWKKLKSASDQWMVDYQLADKKKITMRLGLTAFKHVGLFPEQAPNWEFIYAAMASMHTPKFLNLFAYTGAASLVARAAGAEVVHVDSVKQVVRWAQANAELNQLDQIRWMVDDALKFVKKELRRGRQYQGIILDPPAYGHGPNGEKWRLEEHLAPLMGQVLRLLDPARHLLILNAYSLGLSALVLENILMPYSEHYQSDLAIGELYLQAQSGIKLPVGIWGRLSKNVKHQLGDR